MNQCHLNKFNKKEKDARDRTGLEGVLRSPGGGSH